MPSRSNPILGPMVNTLTAWLAHRRGVAELSRLSDVEFASIAKDLRLSQIDLSRLAHRAPDGTGNLERMFDALGIKCAAIARTEPAVVRDMERVCAACPNATRCRRELRAGTARRSYGAFCANSCTFDVLDRSEALRSGGEASLAEVAS